jgi:hypothetical protein
MGTGFSHGIWIRDVGIVQNAWGKPEVIYSPRGELVRRKLGIGEGHVTLTDEAGLVVAVAVLLRAVRSARAKKRRAQLQTGARIKSKTSAKTKSKATSKRPGKPKARTR